jgi:hypothetical protein
MALYRAKEVWTGTLASSIPDGIITSFTLTSSSGLINGETYVFTIDRVDANGTKTPSKKEVIVGTLSGSNVINCQRGVEGTAQAHSAGAIVEILFTAKHWNDLIDSYKTQHNEDGTHSKIQGLDNNKAITQKDSSGTARDIAKIDSSNVLTFGNTTTITKIKAGSNTTNGHTVPNVADDTVALLSAAQTLSNKIIDSSNSFSIIKPSSDSISAIQITKADGVTPVLNIDTTNISIGIGASSTAVAFYARKVAQLGTTAGSTLDISYFDSKPQGNTISLIIQKYRTANGSDWTTEAVRLMRRTDTTDQAYISFFGNNIGVGIINPGYLLDVNGQCHASSFPTSSDKRFKENVKEIDNALEKVKKLRGVYFNWNKFYRETLKVDETEDTEIGLIAQEIKEVIPEVITTFEREVDGKKEKYYSVEYARLSALLINAIKELAEKVENLEKKYGELNKSRV